MATRLLIPALALALPSAALAQPPAERLHRFLQTAYADAQADSPEMTYTAAFADLNGDGRPEALVMPHAGLFCGSGGCALYIYTPQGSSWRQVDELTVVDAPVRLLPTRTHGWHDLVVSVRSGGTALPRLVRMRMRAGGSGFGASPWRRAAGRVIIADGAPSRRLFR